MVLVIPQRFTINLTEDYSLSYIYIYSQEDLEI